MPAEEQAQVNNVYTVDANGMVNLPYINKVRAEGLTPAQLASCDRSDLSPRENLYQPDDHHRDAAALPVRECGGAVRTPSRVAFTEDMTLLTAINAAGGFNDFADQKRVRLLRGEGRKSIRRARISPRSFKGR